MELRRADRTIARDGWRAADAPLLHLLARFLHGRGGRIGILRWAEVARVAYQRFQKRLPNLKIDNQRGLLMMITLAAGGPAPGSLPPCPRTPNCVSTQATGRQAIAPLRYDGTAEQAMNRLRAVIEAISQATVVSADTTSIRVEFRTRVLRFVDDAVFVVDEAAKTIHFRSASRVGRYDFGVNRRRMEQIRTRFEGG
jgi:uncharacterized protein (DUF1499 family)